MKIKSSRTLKILNIILPVAVISCGTLIFLRNYLYNTRERVFSLSEAAREGTAFVSDDISVRITTRGGDSGSWLSDEMVCSDGSILFTSAVGTIYEL